MKINRLHTIFLILSVLLALSLACDGETGVYSYLAPTPAPVSDPSTVVLHAGLGDGQVIPIGLMQTWELISQIYRSGQYIL